MRTISPKADLPSSAETQYVPRKYPHDIRLSMQRLQGTLRNSTYRGLDVTAFPPSQRRMYRCGDAEHPGAQRLTGDGT